jgi:hypothetical protein
MKRRFAKRLPPLFLLAVLFVWSVLTANLHFAHTGDLWDDGLYLVSAQALSQGLGNTLPSQEGPPVRSRYPVGFPTLISCLLWVNPGNHSLATDVALARAVVLCGGWIFLLAVYGWLRRSRVTPLWALLITLTTAFYYHTFILIMKIFSDIPFAALAYILLWRWSKPERKAWNRWMFINGVLTGLAMAIRTNGITLFLGGLLAAGRKKPGRPVAGLLLSVLGFLLVLVPAYLLAKTGGNQGRTLGGYGAHLSAGWNSPQAIAQVLSTNAARMCARIPAIPLSILDSRAFDSVPLVPKVLQVATLAALFVGTIQLARRSGARDRPAWCHVVLTVGMFLSWPWVFLDRFFLTLFPMIIWATAEGIKTIAQWLRCGHRASHRLATIFLLVAFSTTVAMTGYLSIKALKIGGLWANPVEKSEIDSALDFVRSQTEPNAVVISMTPELVYLYTDRKGIMMSSISELIQSRLDPLDGFIATLAQSPDKPFYLWGPPPESSPKMEAYVAHPSLSVQELYRSKNNFRWIARVQLKNAEEKAQREMQSNTIDNNK